MPETIHPVTICFCSHTGCVSGAEVVLLSVLQSLDRARYTPVLVAPDGELVQTAGPLNIEHHSIRERGLRFTANPYRLAQYSLQSILQIAELRKIFRQVKPALIHANSIRAGLTVTLASYGLRTRVVWHLHDILPENAAGTAIRLFANSLRNTTFLAVSHATAHGFAFVNSKRVIARDVPMIYNSVDSARFRPDVTERESVRQELCLGADDVAIGAVAQITPRKRQHELLEAFAASHRTMPRAFLFFVGSGQFQRRNMRYLARLRARCEELALGDSVRFLGRRSDIPAILNAMDVIVQNSDREPLGMSILEAMATAKPVVSTCVDGTPEVISEGCDGFLVPLHDPSELMRRLKLLCDDVGLRQQMGERGQAKVLEFFSPAEQARRMHALYDHLLHHGSPSTSC